jgi:hypothetical protein
MPPADRLHDVLAVTVVSLFLLALVAAVSAAPDPILGTLWGVGVAALVLVGSLAVGYALMGG